MLIITSKTFPHKSDISVMIIIMIIISFFIFNLDIFTAKNIKITTLKISAFIKDTMSAELNLRHQIIITITDNGINKALDNCNSFS